MELSTPALLFPAISLLLLAYTNRFLGLANVIRGLHQQINETNKQLIARQIISLQLRIKLIIRSEEHTSELQSHYAISVCVLGV